MISSPRDLKLLSNEELTILAQEIREQIVTTTAANGGHVASSLGAVDIILALHSELNCPYDRLLFDVGHQAYAHKILTGRLDSFDTLRQFGGISGFPKPAESPYDSHPSGHASDSLSVALGLARARDLRGSNEKIAVVIGDASISGGMAFEALNQIGQEQTQLLIVLNDNEMSISPNVGALMIHFGKLRASNEYRIHRDAIQAVMEDHGRVSSGVLDWARNVKDSMKHFFLPESSLMFEQMGIVCTAPVDGHDIATMREIIDTLLDMNGPAIMHVGTQKGIGYEPAVREPERFHGVGPYDIKTGKALGSSGGAPKYMDVFGEALCKEAEADPDVVAITAAMKSGTGLSTFAQKFPDRFIDVGIAEEHAVGLAAGLAFGGKKPVAAIYSTFLQRAVDQLAIDVALPDANVTFCIDRAGLVGDDGPTHHGIFDLVYTRMIPHMRVLVPSNEAQLVNGLHTALALEGPVSIRYPRGTGVGVPIPETPVVLEPGVSTTVRDGDDVAILAFGTMVQQALGAAELLAEEGISARVVDMLWAKPLDREAILAAAQTKLVVTVEEGVITGGVGQAILNVLSQEQQLVPTMTLGISDAFVPQGKVSKLYEMLGIDAEGIAKSIRERYRAL